MMSLFVLSVAIVIVAVQADFSKHLYFHHLHAKGQQLHVVVATQKISPHSTPYEGAQSDWRWYVQQLL